MRLMQNTDQDTRELYSERLTPSLWLLVTIALLGPMVTLTIAPFNSTVALVIGGVVSLGLVTLSILASARLRVVGTVLHAGRAHIDVSWLGEPQEVSGEQAKAKRTHDFARNGWHLLRGGIDGMVVIPVTDPDDPARSWTISSRTPDRLAAAIRTAQASADIR